MNDSQLFELAGKLAEHELAAFTAKFEVAPVPRRQELRAGSIAWVAAFLPEACTQDFRETLEQFLHAASELEDYSYRGWYCVPALAAAVYVLSGRLSALTSTIVNVDHHNSSLRTYVIESLAFAAPRLTFDNDELRTRVESNLSSN